MSFGMVILVVISVSGDRAFITADPVTSLEKCEAAKEQIVDALSQRAPLGVAVFGSCIDTSKLGVPA